MTDVKQAANRVIEQVSLRSEDGVLFEDEVQKMHLMCASAVFRDTFALPAPQSKVSTIVPIDMGSHSHIVKLFINLIKHSRLPELEVRGDSFPPGHALAGRGTGTCVNILAALLELLHRFDCEIALSDRAVLHFGARFGTDPWGAYCLAAKYDDLPMAKMAMKAVHTAQGATYRMVDVSGISVADAGRVPIKWFLAFCRTQATVEYLYKDLSRTEREYWEKFAYFLKLPET